MPPIEIRPFRRSDRDQVTALVNAHIEAVLPGVSVSANAVLSQLEREPGEYVVDPWVVARETLVAVHRDRVVAAAHLLRYGTDDRVGDRLRGAGELRWFVFWPGQHPAAAAESNRVADALATAAVATLRRAGVRVVLADFGLPAPGVYGVPAVWPHVAGALRRCGFVPGERQEVVLVAEVSGLPRGGPAPLPGLELAVRLGGHGTRFDAVLDDRVIGFHEVQSDLTVGGTMSRLAGWAEVWELHVEPAYRRRGVGSWLVGHAADRLRLARADRLLSYVEPDSAEHAFHLARGWAELTRTRRGWELDPG
jgi:GNAT superfamily N-acetyltransferase